MGTDWIEEEKIIDGVKTEFSYKKNMFGMKGKLSSKKEYIGEKIVWTSYQTYGSDSGYICSITEYKYDNEGRMLRDGVSKEFSKEHPKGLGPHHPDFREENVKYYLKQYGDFRNGLLNGIYIENFINGNKYREFNFKDGKEHGVFNEYYFNGNLKWTCTFKNGVPNGTHQTFYENGIQSTVCKWENGIPIGEDIHYDTNGQIEEKVIFIDGLKTIRKEIYHPNSNQVKSIDHFINNRTSDTDKYPQYIRLGTPSFTWGEYISNCFIYILGIPHGHSVEYTINGDVIEEGEFENGNRKGSWIINEDLRDTNNEQNVDDDWD